MIRTSHGKLVGKATVPMPARAKAMAISAAWFLSVSPAIWTTGWEKLFIGKFVPIR